MAAVETRLLTGQQFLITTLVFKIAIMALLATMLVRYRRFRHILIFERRGIFDRGLLAFSLGIPLIAGVAARILLRYDAADLTLEGAFLVGIIAGPYAGAMVGALTAVPACIAARVERAALRRGLRLRRRRPARVVPERGDLALLAVCLLRAPPPHLEHGAPRCRWTGRSSWCWRRLRWS